MHIAVDATYFGPLYITHKDQVQPGWTSVLVIGESAMGKSQIATRLAAHYDDPGERADAKNLTAAGLIGGIDTYGQSGAFISWGLLVRNDRMRITLEELKGIKQEALQATTDARSSGQARISKIKQGVAWCRTRMLALSNPVRSGDMKAYSVGARAISEVVKAPEDIRRFDLAMVVSESQLDMSNYRVPDVEHRFTKPLNHRLMLWTWHLNATQVIVEEDAPLEEEANKLIKRFYFASIPLVDKGTAKFKMLRIAASIAGRTFSEHDGKLLVRSCHVRLAAQVMAEVYGDDSCKLDRLVEVARKGDTLYSAEKVTEVFQNEQYGRFLYDLMMSQDDVTLQDIIDTTSGDRQVGEAVLSCLVQNRALKRLARTSYRKTRGLIALLEQGIDAPPPEDDM
jgi:hypothetical protein